MITCNLVGPGQANCGLGNQLFQVASILSYAKDNDLLYSFPCLTDSKYGSYKNNIFRNINTNHSGESDYYYKEPTFEYSEIPIKESIHVHSSYLQSFKYFQSNRDYIIKMLEMSSVDRKYLIDKYNPKEYVSLHIRRGDYLNYEVFHTNLSKTSYYSEAILKFPTEEFLIFSDDPSWAKEQYPNCRVVEEEDYLEMYLMSLCKSNIIANSTFSWWGAWLNKNINKKVIAPIKWFGPSYNYSTKDLLPPTWSIL